VIIAPILAPRGSFFQPGARGQHDRIVRGSGCCKPAIATRAAECESLRRMPDADHGGVDHCTTSVRSPRTNGFVSAGERVVVERAAGTAPGSRSSSGIA
jgi:hypothetical protein